MTGKTHMIIGAAASIYLLPKLGYDPGLLTLPAAAIGALIPDMDHPKSKINQRILPIKNKLGKMLVYCGLGAFIIYNNSFKEDYITMAGILLIIIGMSHHRSFTHSIIGVSLISIVGTYTLKPMVTMPYIAAFNIGIVSHVVADYITKEGVELFYPFTKKNYRFFIHTSTDSFIEKVISIFLLIFISTSIIH